MSSHTKADLYNIIQKLQEFNVTAKNRIFELQDCSIYRENLKLEIEASKLRRELIDAYNKIIEYQREDLKRLDVPVVHLKVV